jgi:hypothetical protein
MSNTIIIKNGNRIPSSADLAQAELGFDFNEKKLYIGAKNEKVVCLNTSTDIDYKDLSFNTDQIVSDNSNIALIGSALIGTMVIGTS